jgi:hypothetical protein
MDESSSTTDACFSTSLPFFTMPTYEMYAQKTMPMSGSFRSDRVTEVIYELVVGQLFSYLPPMPERDAAIQRLLTANAQWAQDVTKLEPNFFEQSAKGQSPHVRCLSSDYQRRRR